MGSRSLNRPIRRRVDQAGFTLMEILIGVVMLAFVASGSAILITVANRMLGSSTSQNNAQAAIDSDTSRARKLAEDYTCCPGSCTSNVSTITAARSSGKCLGNANDSTYYFPQLAADIPTFTTACESGTLTANLITAIQALGSLPDVSRTVTVDDGDDLTSHRIRLAYSGTGANTGISRIVKLVPTVAAWCP